MSTIDVLSIIYAVVVIGGIVGGIIATAFANDGRALRVAEPRRPRRSRLRRLCRR